MERPDSPSPRVPRKTVHPMIISAATRALPESLYCDRMCNCSLPFGRRAVTTYPSSTLPERARASGARFPMYYCLRLSFPSLPPIESPPPGPEYVGINTSRILSCRGNIARTAEPPRPCTDDPRVSCCQDGSSLLGLLRTQL